MPNLVMIGDDWPVTVARDARRRQTEATILRELRLAGALGRGELARRAGLPRSSVFVVVNDLLARGVLVERAPVLQARRARGRPSLVVALDPSAGLIGGVDIGQGRIRVVLANASHQVVATGTGELPADGDPARLATCVAGLIHTAGQSHGVDLSTLDAIGVGVVGVPGLHRTAEHTAALCDALSGAFGVRVVHGNNTRLAALAEATWGAGRQASELVYVRWSTGVGGGFVLAGHAYAGARDAGGELGHVSVDPTGAVCYCGGRGCLELQIGGPALLAQCRSRGLQVGDLDTLVAQARSRVAIAADVVREAAARLGRVLAGTVVQFDPEMIIIGGELGQLGSLVLDPVRAEVARLAMPDLRRRLSVVPAELGMNDAALGAVAFALRANRNGANQSPAAAQ